jgi:chitin disaccharide deacetylase
MRHTQRSLPWLVVFCTVIAASAAQSADPTFAERLGWPPGSKVVMFHVDDAGMSPDSNRGAIEAVEKGLATSMSIMFPCPAAAEIVRYVKQHPNVDAGVHLTLNSEWRTYRWGPLTDKKLVPGLVDQDGYLWREIMKTAANATAEEIETEMRAQLQRCRSMGLKPTHLDTHMGTVFARPDFIQKYVKIAIESGTPIMLPGGHMTILTSAMPGAAVPLRFLGRQLGEQLWKAGLPVLDDLHPGELHSSPADKKPQIIKFLREVKPGVTQFVVHCTRPSPNFVNITGSGPMRLAELEAMLDPEVKKIVEEEKIILTNWRELKQRRDAVGKSNK